MTRPRPRPVAPSGLVPGSPGRPIYFGDGPNIGPVIPGV